MSETDASLRTALAAAIATVGEREQAIQRAKVALDLASQALAKREAEFAGWVALTARQAEERAAAMRQWAGSPGSQFRPVAPDPSPADVQARDAAEAAVVAARAERLRLAEDLRMAERALVVARREVELAAGHILTTEADRLAQELVAADRIAYRLREQLASIARAYVTASSGSMAPPFSGAVQAALRDVARRPDYNARLVAAYSGWLERLLTDADARAPDADEPTSLH